MRQLIARVTRTVLCSAATARDRLHRLRAPAAINELAEPVQLARPGDVICAPTRPIPVLELRETAWTQPRNLVPRYMVAFEAMTKDEQQVVRQRLAVEANKRWALTLATERAREDSRRRQRAEDFAAKLGLPSPSRWQDDIVIDLPRSLAGVVA
ncbi:hypothetical protein ACIPYS_17660 [Kitasatospora sp. NPDC089913]|uniref:hypothetical protein n=1 Tax=Kitasatospora sp. NPDC089913 TaxID=3364080 RepID=UPI0037FC4C2E